MCLNCHNSTKYQVPSAGFTLVETMVALMIMALVSTVIFLLWRMVTSNYTHGYEEVVQMDEVTTSVRRMVNELREARDGDDGAYPLNTVLDNEIIFYSDVDNDTKTERVHYVLAGNTLRRGLVEPTGDPPSYNLGSEQWKTISTIVNNSGVAMLTYYNNNYPGDVVNNPLIASARLLNTRAIKIHLVVNLSTNFGAPKMNWDGSVRLRNMGLIDD
jgi:prepilin-type N-terminal cleavage/methylation domain-containing protein